MLLNSNKWRDKKGCWRSVDFDLWCEDMEAIHSESDNGNYCLFHIHAGEKGLSPEEFNEAVFERIRKASAEGLECNFSGAIFDGDIDFSTFGVDSPLPKISFADAVFTGTAGFDGTVFSGEANFFGARFEGDVSFNGAEFGGKADFFDSVFMEKVDFDEAVFKKESYISWGSFKKGASLDKTKFLGRSILKRPNPT